MIIARVYIVVYRHTGISLQPYSLAVCLGSLSCWKTQPRPIFNALTEGRRLLPKISRYMAHPSPINTVQSSCPLCRKAPQSMMFPPHASRFGMVFLGLYPSFFFLQTRRVEFILTKLFAYFPVAHPALCRPTNFVPSVLRQLFGLAHSGEVGVWLIECVNRCFLYR